MSTSSPGSSVLTMAASHAPVPEDGKTITGPFVPKTGPRPSAISDARRANCGLRWSIVGRSIARRIRSGTLVGPGIWRKCRPLLLFMGADGSTCAYCIQHTSDSNFNDTARHRGVQIVFLNLESTCYIGLSTEGAQAMKIVKASLHHEA